MSAQVSGFRCEGTFATLREAFPAIHSDWTGGFPSMRAPVAGGTAVLVDTGAGAATAHVLAGRRVAPTAARAARPEDVDIVVHTHLHVDHVGWDRLFPNARYVVSRGRLVVLHERAVARRAPALAERVVPLAEQLVSRRRRAGVRPGSTPRPDAWPHAWAPCIVRGGRLASVGDLVAHELQVVDPELVFVNDMDSECRPRRGAASSPNWRTKGRRRSPDTSAASAASSRRQGVSLVAARGGAAPSNRGACRSWQRLVIVGVALITIIVVARLIDRWITRHQLRPETETRYRVVRRSLTTGSSSSGCSRRCSWSPRSALWPAGCSPRRR